MLDLTLKSKLMKLKEDLLQGILMKIHQNKLKNLFLKLLSLTIQELLNKDTPLSLIVTLHISHASLRKYRPKLIEEMVQ